MEPTNPCLTGASYNISASFVKLRGGKTPYRLDVEAKQHGVGDGVYRFQFSPKATGEFFVQVSLDGTQLKNSPLRINVLD